MKQARKLSLISVWDYPRAHYSAQWQCTVVENPEGPGWVWKAQILSYEPTGYAWKGKVLPEWPADVARPEYPPDLAKSAPPAAHHARIKECERIYEAHPKAVHLIDSAADVVDFEDAARRASQEWVLARIEKYRRPDEKKVAKGQGGHTLTLGPLDMLWRGLAGLWDWLTRPMFALGITATTRNNMLNQIRDAIDAGAGAGLFRVLDGTRPATCGTATTLLAELTYSDPCSGAASGGAATYSAITADASANATGTATWCRAVDSTGTCVFDGSAGTSGTDLILNTTSITIGVQVSCSSHVLTAGNP